MRRQVAAAFVVVCSCACAGEADPLAAAFGMHDGDPFAADRMQAALMLAPLPQRAGIVRRIAASGRDDAIEVLHRLILDEDAVSSATAIEALAGRWPTSMEDVESIRTLIVRSGPIGAAASRFAAAIGDDLAIPPLLERLARWPNDADAEAALRQLLAMPAGCGPQGWTALAESRLAGQEAALTGAERLVAGPAADAMGAVTLIAGMRPAGTRAARVLLDAAGHPDPTVRRMAEAILTTCDAPPAAVWRKNAGEAAAAPEGAADPRQPTAAARRPAPVSAPVQLEASGRTSPWLWPAVATGLTLAGAATWLRLRRRPAPTGRRRH